MANNSKDSHKGCKGIKVLFPKGYKEPYFDYIYEKTGMKGSVFIKTAILECLYSFHSMEQVSYMMYLDDGTPIEIEKCDEYKAFDSKTNRVMRYAGLVTDNIEKKRNRESFMKEALSDEKYQDKTVAEIKNDYTNLMTNKYKKQNYDFTKVWLRLDEDELLTRACADKKISKSAFAILAAKRKMYRDCGIIHDSNRFPF